MKKLLTAMALMIGFIGCGIQRPYPPQISMVMGYGSPMSPYGQTGGMSVEVYDMQEAQLNWNVSNIPGAQGVKVIAAKSDSYSSANYYCKKDIVATKVVYAVDSSSLSSYGDNGSINPNANLATLFNGSLLAFKEGKYAICISALRRERTSSPSYPVYMHLLRDQMSNTVYLKADDLNNDNPYAEFTATQEEADNIQEDENFFEHEEL